VAGGAGGSGRRSTAEEKTEFTVVLTDVGGNKINVIKQSAKSPAWLERAKTLWMALQRPSRKRHKDEAATIKKKFEEAAQGRDQVVCRSRLCRRAKPNCLRFGFERRRGAESGEPRQRNRLRKSGRYLLQNRGLFRPPQPCVQRSGRSFSQR